MLPTLSADSLKTWDTCPQQFEWKVLNRLNWPSNTQNFVLGTRIHKLIDFQARGLPVDALLEKASPDIQSTWRVLQQHPATRWPIVASEWGFEFPVLVDDDTHWITGRIDRVAWHQDQLWIIDWKTGTAAPRKPEQAWQTGIYALAVWHAWMALPSRAGKPSPWLDKAPQQITVAYLSVSPPECKLIKVHLGQEEIAAWQNRLESTLREIRQAEHFRPQPPCPDKWCVFQPMCPAGVLG